MNISSLLKTKHDFIFSFFYNNDYNSKIIKIDLFFVGFTIYYTINALFYNDDTMHKIYEDKGSFDFIYQLPKNIYSSVISIVLNNEYYKELLEQKDFELNSIDYEEDLILDHRNYFQYYISLLKNNYPIIFAFSPYKDYNSRIIKMFLFFYSFSLDFTINAFFFNDDTMHKIYEDKGKFNFFYQLPQIIYSSLISRFIDSLMKNLALSQDIFLSLKKEKDKKKLDKEQVNKYLKILKIKFTLILIYFMHSIIIKEKSINSKI